MALIRLSHGVWVRPDDIVAIHDHVIGMTYTVEAYETPEPKSALVLRNGAVIPCYLSQETLKQKLRDVGGGSVQSG